MRSPAFLLDPSILLDGEVAIGGDAGVDGAVEGAGIGELGEVTGVEFPTEGGVAMKGVVGVPAALAGLAGGEGVVATAAAAGALTCSFWLLPHTLHFPFFKKPGW